MFWFHFISTKLAFFSTCQIKSRHIVDYYVISSACVVKTRAGVVNLMLLYGMVADIMQNARQFICRASENMCRRIYGCIVVYTF